ncbi:MAG: hypothetical protein V4507_15995 [Verrucomicrobiota bacterium]
MNISSKITVGLIFAAFLNAETVSDYAFDEFPSKSQWSSIASPTVSDGQIVFDTSTDESVKNAKEPISLYENCGITTKAQFDSEKLNFFKNKVEMVFSDLMVTGTGKPKNQIFVFIITADKAGGESSSAFIRLRVSAEGEVLLQMRNFSVETGSEVKDDVFFKAKVMLPIKRLALKMSKEDFGISITGNDSLEQTIPWSSSFDISRWNNIPIFLSLKGVRTIGDEGHTVVTLGNFKIDSNP